MTIKVVIKAIRHTATGTNTVISMFSEDLAGGVRLDGEMTTVGTVEIGLSEKLGERVGGLSVNNNIIIDKLCITYTTSTRALSQIPEGMWYNPEGAARGIITHS